MSCLQHPRPDSAATFVASDGVQQQYDDLHGLLCLFAAAEAVLHLMCLGTEQFPSAPVASCLLCLDSMIGHDFMTSQ